MLFMQALYQMLCPDDLSINSNCYQKDDSSAYENLETISKKTHFCLILWKSSKISENNS